MLAIKDMKLKWLLTILLEFVRILPDELVAVQVQVDVDQVGQQPLGVPVILLGNLHFQIPREELLVKSLHLDNTYLHFGPLVSCSSTASSIQANLSASSGLMKGSYMAWMR